MNWQFHTFDTLDTRALFDLMKLRVDVFVVEQQCAYPELDSHDVDPHTLHLLGYQGSTLAAYARAMPPVSSTLTSPRTSGDTPAKNSPSGVVKIGRVVVAPSHRGSGVAQTLMDTMISRLSSLYPTCPQCLAAQYAIRRFYQDLGFQSISDTYLEDGIEHIDMQRAPSIAADSTTSTNQSQPE